MMIFQAAVGGVMKGQNPPHITKQILLEYVKAEYAFFCLILNLVINMKRKHSHGNVFAQVIHDGFTLVKLKRFQSLSL